MRADSFLLLYKWVLVNTLKFYDMRGNMNSIIHFNRRFAKHVICKNVYGLHFSQDYIDIEFAPGASHKALRFVNTTKNCPDADFGDTFTRSHAKILDIFTSLQDVSILRQNQDCEQNFRVQSRLWPKHLQEVQVCKVLLCNLIRDDTTGLYRREVDVVMEGGIRCIGNVSLVISLPESPDQGQSCLKVHSDQTLVRWNLLSSFN